jgi:hypothetical protein
MARVAGGPIMSRAPCIGNRAAAVEAWASAGTRIVRVARLAAKLKCLEAARGALAVECLHKFHYGRGFFSSKKNARCAPRAEN